MNTAQWISLIDADGDWIDVELSHIVALCAPKNPLMGAQLVLGFGYTVEVQQDRAMIKRLCHEARPYTAPQSS